MVADVIQSHALNFKIREAGRKIIRKRGTISELLDKMRAWKIEMLNEEVFAKNHPHSKPVEEVGCNCIWTI